MTRRAPTLDGSTSRTVILLAALAAIVALAWNGTVAGDAAVGIISAIIGGVLHASGTKQGSEASVAPPPTEGP